MITKLHTGRPARRHVRTAILRWASWEGQGRVIINRKSLVACEASLACVEVVEVLARLTQGLTISGRACEAWGTLCGGTRALRPHVWTWPTTRMVQSSQCC